MLGVADHAIIKTRADGKQHIAILHRQIGFISAVHAEHADELLVGRRITAEAHQCVGAGKTQRAHQLRQLRGRITQNDAAAGINHRALGGRQHLDGFFDLPRMALGHRVVRTHTDAGGIGEFGLCRSHVFGNIHHHRPRPAGRCNVERFLDGNRDIFDVTHQKIMLDARARNADGIAFLKRVFADGVGGHLPGNHHQRNRIGIGRGDAGNRIGHAGAGCDQRHAHFIGRARVAVGGMQRALLVTHEDMLDLILLEQLVINKQHRAARITEHVFDSFFLQAAHNNFCTRQLHGKRNPENNNRIKRNQSTTQSPRTQYN